VGPAIVVSHDLDVLVARSAIAVLVLNASVGEVHVLVEVRQVVLACPSCDLFRLSIRSAVAVLPTSIALVKARLGP
jgi:hypothetical protein